MTKKTWLIIGLLLLAFGIIKLVLLGAYYQPQDNSQTTTLTCPDPTQGRALPGGGKLVFDTTPQPEKPFSVELQDLNKDITAPSADFEMQKMDMGKNQYRFTPGDKGRRAHVTLPACHSGSLDWIMTLRVGEQTYKLPFSLQPNK